LTKRDTSFSAAHRHPVTASFSACDPFGAADCSDRQEWVCLDLGSALLALNNSHTAHLLLQELDQLVRAGKALSFARQRALE
jgi:hypothetical protein